MKSVHKQLVEILQNCSCDQEAIDFINETRELLHDNAPIKQPIDIVRWVPVEKVKPNDYNPNSVAKVEMGLLYKSIKHDGYTQPVVTIYDEEKDEYVIVDGFHRYFTCKNNKDIYERNKGHLPVVVIKKDLNERMAATVRHNRARGSHSVNGMSSMVFQMLDNGWSDSEICNHLGMEADELLKLKHITGFSKLFKDAEYARAWENKNMIKLRKEYEQGEGKQTT
jgi:ParB-like chromosome segregation protein Spo0J